MSRPYRILVQKVIEEELRAADRSVLYLRLDPVLPEADLERILTAVLARRGWVEVEPGVFEQPREDGQSVTLDLTERTVTTEVALARTLRETRRRKLEGDTWNWHEQREMTDEEFAQMQQSATDALGDSVTESRRRRAEEALRTQAAAALAETADERRREVNQLVLEVLAEALKEKAAELGHVERVDEQWQGEDYELTISIAE